MRRALFILLAIILLPSLSFSMWASIPLDELVQDSDLIIVGTLKDVYEYTRDETDYGEGIIRVDEVIWGDRNQGDMLRLKWSNYSGIVCPRVEHRQNENKKGIWLLTLDSEYNVRADYPGRFIRLKQKDQVKTILREKKVCVRRSGHALSGGEPSKVSLVYRNPTEDEIDFPGVVYGDGHLWVSPDAELALYRGWGEEGEKLSPLANRLMISDSLAPISVGRKQEYRVTLDLKNIFDLRPDEAYVVRFKAKGFDPANQTVIYVESGKDQKRKDTVEPARHIFRARQRSDVWWSLPLIGLILLSGSVGFFRYQINQ